MMESTDVSNWTNGSRFLQNVSNDSFDISKGTPVVKTNYIDSTVLTLCFLGLPGNLLVIAVYMRNMTSSLKIYMFALAVADSAICVCVVIFSLQMRNRIFFEYATYAFNVAVFFSMFLLVFVAIERLVAILRPHSFNKKPRRAWKALLIIAAVTVVFVISLYLMRGRQFRLIKSGFKVGVGIVSVLIIIVCYTGIAASLLARARTARKRVSTFNPTASTKLRSSHFQKVTPITSVDNLNSGQNPSASTIRVTSDTTRPYQRNEHLDCPGTVTVTTLSLVPTNKSTAEQSTAYKNVSLLFIITVIFIVCWLPFWLHSMGVPIVLHSDRLFVVNSAVNPFIYGVVSAMFREDVRQFYRLIRVKLSACYH